MGWDELALPGVPALRTATTFGVYTSQYGEPLLELNDMEEEASATFC